MEERWVSYKETLRDLYLVQDLTLKEIARDMKQNYSFDATTGQYERQFKKWDFRKNLTKEEWQLVSRRVEKRKREGKETEIRIDGVQVPPKKLQKALSRYGQGTTLDRLQREIRARMEFRSPTPPRGVSFSPPPAPCSLLYLTNLPWCKFLSSVAVGLQGQVGVLQALPGSMIDQLQATQPHMRAFLPKLDLTGLGSLQQAWHSTGFQAFGLAVFFASNHVLNRAMAIEASESNKFMIDGLLRVFEALNVTSKLSLVNPQHDPTADAVLQVLLKQAIETSNINLARYLLSHFTFDMTERLPGPWPSKRSDMIRPHALVPLQAAIELGDVPLVELLLSHGAQVDIVGPRGHDMLCIAARARSERIIRLLLPHFTRSAIPALVMCLKERLFDTGQLLWDKLQSSPEVIKRGTAILSAAASCNHVQIIRYLLDQKIDVNSFDETGWTPLQQTVLAGHGGPSLTTMKLLVDRGARVDHRLVGNHLRMPTALQLALHFSDNPVIVEFLLQAGADPNAECPLDPHKRHLGFSYLDLEGCTALKILLQRRISSSPPEGYPEEDLHLVRQLLIYGAELDERSWVEAVQLHRHDLFQLFYDSSDTNAPFSADVLFAAVRAGNKKLIQMCLDAGLDVNCVSNRETLLTTALGYSRTDSSSSSEFSAIYELLLERGASVNPPDVYETPLALAINNEQQDIIPVLLSKGARCDDSGVLYAAACTGNGDLLEEILDAAEVCPGFRTRLSSSCLGHQALNGAADCGQMKMANILIQRGINLASPCTAIALQTLCDCKFPDITFMDHLLSKGVSPNISGVQSCPAWPGSGRFQPLQILSMNGKNDEMRLLLRHGANPDSFDRNKQMCILTSAVMNGHLSSVNILLKAGAEVNQPALGWRGKTPLQMASLCGCIDIIERLLEAEADVNAPPARDGGVTALQVAAINGYVGIAAKLIEHGADVNAPAAEENGWTALEGACHNGSLDMVDLLVRAGLDLRTARHESALTMARKNGFNAVARLLERHLENAGMEELFDFGI